MVEYYDRQTNILTKEIDLQQGKVEMDESTIENSKIA